jgi:hypothetical protein
MHGMTLTLPEAVYWEEKVVKRAKDLAEVAKRREKKAQGFEGYDPEANDMETEETEDMSEDKTFALLKAEVAEGTVPSKEARNEGNQFGCGSHQSNTMSGLEASLLRSRKKKPMFAKRAAKLALEEE